MLKPSNRWACEKKGRAMNFLVNLYFREGPGIDKNAPAPTGLRLLAHVAGREWWELIKLNVLVIAFSLPLVTLPAAWFAATRIGVMMIEDRNIYLLRDFWAAFRAGFWRATGFGALLLAGGTLAVLAVQSYAALALESLIYAAPLALAIAMAVLIPLFALYLFTALAMDMAATSVDLIKAAALGLLRNPLAGLSALAVICALWIAHILFYPASVILPVMVNFSFGALIGSFGVMGGVRFGLARLSSAQRAGERAQPEIQMA